MAYVYKKLIHGKPYYYLRISKRVKGKVVVKDIAYLGSDISELRKKLDRLPLLYKSDIRKAYRNIKKFIEGEYYLTKVKELKLKESEYLNKKTLEEIEAIKLHFNNSFLKKDKEVREEAFKNFLIDFAFNTTSLEGNTITLSEANKLLKENLTPKNRTLREIYDLQNTEGAFFELINSNKKMDHDLIVDIHDKLLKNIDGRRGYRKHDIRVFRATFEASPYVYIKTDMGLLFKWVNNYEKKLNPLVLAGIFHQKFEKIHPFSDGNGRTGRMILCYMLIKRGYPPLIVKKSKRGEYLDSLAIGNKADLNNIEPKYYKPIVEYLAQEMIDSYWTNFNV